MVASEKLCAAFILFGLASASGILPCITVKCLILRLGTSTKFKRAIGLLNCLSGGVFFATSVLDLLPEAREGMNNVLEHFNTNTDYPISELLMCMGFFIILTLEHIAHSCCPYGKQKQPTNEETSSVSNVSTETPGIIKQSSTCMKTKLTSSSSPILLPELDNKSHREDYAYHTYGTVDEYESVESSSRPHGALSRNRSQGNAQILYQHNDQVVITTSPNQTPEKEEIKRGIDSLQRDNTISKIRGVVLLIALSLHMIFDGLALGLLQKPDKIWTLLAALALHKVLMFYTIGIQALGLLASNRKTIILIIFFAFISPIGIAIGESLNSAEDEISRDLTSAVLQGIATGTFLFVTFFEILQRELGTGEHDLLKVFMAVFGFVLVAIVRLLSIEDR